MEKNYKPKINENNLSIIQDTDIKGKIRYLVGNKEDDRYLIMNKKMASLVGFVSRYLNGENDLECIQFKIMDEINVKVHVEELVNVLGNIGLIDGIEPQNKSSEINLMGIKIFEKNFCTMNKNFIKVSKYLVTIVKMIFIIMAFYLIIYGLIHFGDFSQGYIINLLSYKNSYIKAGIIMYIISIFSILLHEMAHMCMVAKCGLQVKKIGISLYMGIIPMFYSKCKGMYTINIKSRLGIMGAGIFINIVIIMTSLCITLQNIPYTYKEVIYKIILVNASMVASNISPFRLSDGYFIMSNLFGLNNLRINMFKGIVNLRLKGFNIKKNLGVIVYLTIFIIISAVSIFYWFVWVRHFILEINSIIFKAIFLAIIIVYVCRVVLRIIKKFKHVKFKNI